MSNNYLATAIQAIEDLQLKNNKGDTQALIGAQLKGDSVKLDVGNNLNIESLQDSDNYDYDKITASVNGSFGTGFSGNLALSQTKMDSNWASVTDQSGIFAGKNGFDVTVGNNTDLKGAVIASTAEDKSNNKLDTGTISFSDIENKADFDVSHVSISIGTSGASPTAGMPSIYHNSDSASSTTKSAVEDGTLIVRNQDEQKQNVDELSRNTENANNPLGQIFDKQKEQDRMDAIDLVRDIVVQGKNLGQKYSKIEAQLELKAQGGVSDKQKDEAIEALNRQGIKATPEAIYNYTVNQLVQKNGIGSMGDGFSKGLDAASAIVIGIISGDITGGLAGASAPYLAEQIKKQTGHYDEAAKDWKTDDKAANLIAHAILGAAVAAAQGNSALAGGIGAVSGEAAADYIRKTLYDGRDPSDLTQAEKENISALAQLASGLAVAAGSGGNIGDVGTAVAGSKNAVENNRLATVVEERIVDKLVKDGHDQHKLDAASCALIKCYAQYAIGSEAYNQALSLAKEGEQYKDEQVLLKNSTVTVHYTLDPVYWNKVGEKVSKEEGGFGYSQKDQIADGQQSTDEFKINYIAKELGVDPGVVRLTETGFNLMGQAGSLYYAGKLTKPGGMLSDDPYLAKAEKGGTLNIGAGNKPIEGTYNISNPDYLMGKGVYAGNANDLSKIATGSQKTIIMENPYGFKPFNDEILRVLDNNGTIIIKGSWNNPSMKNLEKIAESKGFTLSEKNIISSKGYSQSDGMQIKNETITEYIFNKK
ncbi:VENN motif pre-toxin domain-containing protein [Orbus wheelerorum]|uniref:VENN motif pre-toxin domain-containing protein n=1 Tax=Orbus wheelerorum TaxID=3074111 RepID=UPI00370D7603